MISSGNKGHVSPPHWCINHQTLRLTYWPNLLDPTLADQLKTTLLEETPWRQPELLMFGRSVRTPRLTAWYGDEQATYRYSGVTNTPRAWTVALRWVKEIVECATAHTYNSVLLNLYRDGEDHVSWHRDDEPELGLNPTIASLSLGATRVFRLRAAATSGKRNITKIELTNGSLLCMAGQTQNHWEHSIKKEPGITDSRINLTFRTVLSNPDGPPKSGRQRQP